MTTTVDIPYLEKLHHETYEVGPIGSKDLSFLMINAPPISSTAFFKLGFLAKQGTIPESSADLIIDVERRTLNLEKPSVYQSQFEAILKGGKLETLSLRYPVYHRKKEDFGLSGEAFEILRENLEIIQRSGYDLIVPSFGLSNHMVKVPDEHPGFFSDSYGAKIVITTEGLVKDQPERKLILKFTPDLASSDEVQVYRGILDSINSSRS